MRGPRGLAACMLSVVIGALLPLQVLATSDADTGAVLNGTEYYAAEACGDSGTPTALTGNDNEQKAFNYFIQQGLSKIQSAAMVGNFYAESGVSPTSQQDGSKDPFPKPNIGFGIAQWTSVGRQDALTAYAKQKNLAVTDFGLQLDFSWKELTGSYPGAYSQLKNMTDIRAATVLVMIQYESPQDQSVAAQDKRTGYAQDALKNYGGSSPGNDTTPTAAGTTSGGCSQTSATAAGGVSVPPGQIAFPINAMVVDQANWTEDQGVDIATAGGGCGPNAPLVAIGDGEIVGIGIDGFGQWSPVEKITSGPLKDRYVYYGHAKPNVAKVGDKVTAGQVIADVGCGIVGKSTGPHLEIGIWPKGKTPSDSFPKMNETSGEMMAILKTAYSQGHK